MRWRHHEWSLFAKKKSKSIFISSGAQNLIATKFYTDIVKVTAEQAAKILKHRFQKEI